MGNCRKDVGIFNERQVRRGLAGFFLEFPLAGIGHAPVGDGGGEDGHIRWQCAFDRLQHVAGGFHMQNFDIRRVGQGHRPADQHHLGAGGGGGCGYGVTLFAGRAVGDVAHRIDRLMGWARCDQHALSCERPRFIRAEQFLHRRRDLQWFRHAANAALIRFRHLAGVGTNQRRAVGDQLREIALRRSVRPHARVHRRCEQDFRIRRQQHGAGEIGGEAKGQFRHQIGGRRRDHDQIGLARQPDVADIELTPRIEQIGEHALAGDGAGRQRGDEMLRRFGENAAYGNAAFFQAPDEIERLVGGDAAADDQQHALAIGGLRCLGAAWRFRRRRIDRLQRLQSGFLGRRLQNRAHLVLDRAPATGRAQPQKLLEPFVELSDSQGGHINYTMR